jgi:hypothetical protein
MRLLFLLLLFLSHYSYSQDTIVKNNNEKIVAKIFEINATEIKFKKFNFQDGPTYIELKSNIKMIVYSNGMKEIFEEKNPVKPPVFQPSSENDYYDKTYTSAGATGKIEPFKSKYKVEEKIINEKSMRKLLLETNDPKIITLVNQSKKAQRRQFIWIAALPLAQIALVSFASAPAQSYQTTSPTTGTTPGTTTTVYQPQRNGLYVLGAITLAGAVACPIISVKQKHKKKSTTTAAIKLYNQKF